MSAVTTWADGRGTWHARVPRGAASPLIAARRALRDEIAARQDIATVDRSVWMRPVRVPDLDTPDTVVYREGDTPAMRLEYLRGELRAGLADLVEIADSNRHETEALLAELGGVYIRAVTGEPPTADRIAALENRVRGLLEAATEIHRALSATDGDAVVADAEQVRDALLDLAGPDDGPRSGLAAEVEKIANRIESAEFDDLDAAAVDSIADDLRDVAATLERSIGGPS